MERRKFTRSVLMTAASPLVFTGTYHKRKKKVKRIKPKALEIGNTIGLIAPASGIKPGQLETAVSQMESLGLKVQLGKYAESQNGFLAGMDHERIWDIHQMLVNDEIDGIWCIRGGYGMSRIVPNLDIKKFIKNPKLIIGYSDVTILNQFAASHGLVTIHGQIAGAEFTPEVAANLKSVIFGNLSGKTIAPKKEDTHYTIRSGIASGELTGGNLSLLSAIAGTPYLDSFRNKIVFIEDIGEKPYRVDRMLTQLIQATDLDKASGIALGVFEDCEMDEGDKSWTLRQVLEDRLGQLGIPVCYGLPFGHVDQNMTMPLLVRVTLDADEVSMTYEEEAVL